MENGKRGRPRIEINLDKLKELCELLCTDEELAAHLGVSWETIQRRKKNDKAFIDIYIKGRQEGKISLRRLQWQNAQKGNVTMQIWLGKQLLGQSDRVEHTGKDGGSIRFVIGEDGGGNGNSNQTKSS